MAEGYNFLEGSQTDINRRLLRKIQALEKATGIDTSDIDELQETVGDENSGLVKDVNTLKTTVGSSNSGLVKDMSDAQAAIGTDDTTSGSLKKRCKDIETEIGTDETADSIKGRLYALEHPANNG